MEHRYICRRLEIPSILVIAYGCFSGILWHLMLAQLPIPARQIQRRAEFKTLCAICDRLFGAVAIMFTGFLLLCDTLLVLGPSGWIGTKTSGRVIQKVTPVDGVSKFKGIGYAFRVEETVYTGSTGVSDEALSKLAVGDQIQVAYLDIYPQRLSCYVSPQGQLPFQFWPLLLVAIFLLVSLICACHHHFYLPCRNRRLLRYGETTTGRITFKKQSKARSNGLHLVRFTYNVGGEEFTSKMRVERCRYNSVEFGSKVLVLFDPSNPKRAMTEELFDWEIVHAT